MTEREYKTNLNGKDSEGNGWQRWKVYVLETIEKIEGKVDNIEEKRKNCQLWCTQEITKLKVKSSIWGAIAGFIASLILTLVISLSAGFITKNVSLEEHKEQKHLKEKKHTEHEKDIQRLERILENLKEEKQTENK